MSSSNVRCFHTFWNVGIVSSLGYEFIVIEIRNPMNNGSHGFILSSESYFIFLNWKESRAFNQAFHR